MKKKNICDKAKALTFLGLQQPHCGGRRAARLSPAAGLQDPRAQAELPPHRLRQLGAQCHCTDRGTTTEQISSVRVHLPY